ncbi:hypothetical protein RhiirC2_803739, partial [Rhizophagus irregularis]
MKKCWDEDPLKRPSSKEVLNIIENWIFLPQYEVINKELKSNILEFINTPIEHNNLIVKSHPKACYTSHLFDFTSEELNEMLEDSQAFLKFLKHKYQSSQIKLQNIQMELVNLQQRNSQTEEEILKLEKIAETYYQSSQNELVNLQLRNSQTEVEKLKLEMIAETYYQSSHNELVNLQQRNSQTEEEKL